MRVLSVGPGGPVFDRPPKLVAGQVRIPLRGVAAKPVKASPPAATIAEPAPGVKPANDWETEAKT